MSENPKKPGRTTRISLTKKQRESEIGAELLSLCQTATADGSLSPEEIVALRDWLDDNKDADLPAISHLTGVVHTIIADRRVTLEERRELFIAIEAVLPADIRGISKNARRTREERERQRLRIQREAERQRQSEERERNDPIEHWDFMVAGSRYEGRPEVISRHAHSGDSAFLVRDRNNKYSRNAIEVRTSDGHQIGFVPEDEAIDISPLLDAGHPYLAEIKKILTGGRAPIPVVIAEVYRKDATVPDLVQPEMQPPRTSLRAPAASVTRSRVPLMVSVVIVSVSLFVLAKACSWGA